MDTKLNYKKVRKIEKEDEKKEEEEKDKLKDDKKQIPKILKVLDPKNLKIKPCHPHLPKPPACLLICGPVKTGKSTLISNLLLSPLCYGKEYFDEVVIISNTIMNDITGRFLLKTFTCHSEYNDDIVYNILKQQEEDGELNDPNDEDTKDHRKDICLIFDDIMGSIKRESVANFIATRFRHYNIKLLVYSVQNFRGISCVVRQNITDLIVLSPFPNKKELQDKVFMEYGDLFDGPKIMEKIYKIATPKRHDFLYCKLGENPAQAYHNFEYQIAEGGKILVNDNNINSDSNSDCDSINSESSDCDSSGSDYDFK